MGILRAGGDTETLPAVIEIIRTFYAHRCQGSKNISLAPLTPEPPGEYFNSYQRLAMTSAGTSVNSYIFDDVTMFLAKNISRDISRYLVL